MHMIIERLTTDIVSDPVYMEQICFSRSWILELTGEEREDWYVYHLHKHGNPI